jgi:NADH-quinone oxidoreductase subunit M
MNLLLLALVVVPFVGAALAPIATKYFKWTAKAIGLTTALVTLVLALVIAVNFDTQSSALTQFDFKVTWIDVFGISFHIGVTGIGLVLVLLTSVLTPVVLWADFHASLKRPVLYTSLILLLAASANLIFLARDLFLFYVFFEAMLIPVFFLIGIFGGANRSKAAMKFLLYGLAGGLIMLAAIVSLTLIATAQLQRSTFDIATLSSGINLTATQELWLFIGFFIAFAIKAPMVPLHTWLPDTAEQATAGTSTMLIGILDKIGTFGMIVLVLPLFPNASAQAAPWIIALAVISVIYGAILAIGQKDIRRLFAYTSISHFGFIVMGIFAFTTVGIAGATLYMVAHGLSTAALFLVAGHLIKQRETALIANYGGLTKVAPVMSGLFLMAALSALALPGMAGFVSEFMVLTGVYQRYQGAAIVATLGIILAAIYMLWLYQRVFTGPENENSKLIKDLSAKEVWPLVPVFALLIVFGFWPQPVLGTIEKSVDNLMQQINSVDPAPLFAIDAEEQN